MSNNDVVLGRGSPIEERVSRLAGAWLRDERGGDHLLTGRAFFAVYSWYLWSSRQGAGHDTACAEYVAASYDAIGGGDGWNAMLRERAVCESCWDTYRLENIGVCTGCMRYTCYACDAHGSCAGEIV
ncbi:hypothetical protein [Streptomyces sp. NPDC059863]|uniref:hypothetical protein n=1 Tax=unclassified Streptomyces TaxID=2593676 RepID=UPI00365E0910